MTFSGGLRQRGIAIRKYFVLAVGGFSFFDGSVFGGRGQLQNMAVLFLAVMQHGGTFSGGKR